MDDGTIDPIGGVIVTVQILYYTPRRRVRRKTWLHIKAQAASLRSLRLLWEATQRHLLQLVRFDHSIDETADTIEDTVMGDSVKTYLPSLKDATLTVDALWDDADTQQLALDSNATINWEIHPSGTGTGRKYYEGEGVVTAKTVSASYDGLVEASFSIQCSGAVTEGTN